VEAAKVRVPAYLPWRRALHAAQLALGRRLLRTGGEAEAALEHGSGHVLARRGQGARAQIGFERSFVLSKRV
jgi:hypothetical protein